MAMTKIVLMATWLMATSALAESGTAALAETGTAPRSPLDMPIERIAATSDGCAVLDKDFPGLRAHPMYGSFKRMSLNQIAAMSKGQITPQMMTQAQADLSALPTQELAPLAATPVSAEP